MNWERRVQHVHRSTLEAAAREAIRLDEPRALLDRFVDARARVGHGRTKKTAGHYIVERLHALGVPVTLHTPELYISLPERAELDRHGSRRRARRSRAAAGDGAIDRRRRRSRARSATCRRATRPARRSLFDMPDAARAAATGADPGRRPDRPHRGLLDAGPGAGLRAARRDRADLHPSRRAHSRGHLHVDLGRADGGIDRPQADDAGRLHQPSGWRSAHRARCSAAPCARR